MSLRHVHNKKLECQLLFKKKMDIYTMGYLYMAYYTATEICKQIYFTIANTESTNQVAHNTYQLHKVFF